MTYVIYDKKTKMMPTTFKNKRYKSSAMAESVIKRYSKLYLRWENESFVNPELNGSIEHLDPSEDPVHMWTVANEKDFNENISSKALTK
jgi:hypothetical protein